METGLILGGTIKHFLNTPRYFSKWNYSLEHSNIFKQHWSYFLNNK